MRELHISGQEAGKRVDQVLCRCFGLSRSQARRACEQGWVERNGRKAHKGETLALGDHLACTDLPLDPAALPDAGVPVTLRYGDRWLLVIDKPSGVPTHPLAPSELGTAANWIAHRYPDIACGFDSRQPGLVHRLDNHTSGLLLVARDPDTLVALRTALEAGQVHKTYHALTQAPLAPQEIALALAAGRHPRSPVRPATEGPLRCTRIVACAPRGRLFLVEAQASCAYRHQVRAHLAARGAPILGDALYGGDGALHHHLHASRIAFDHPVTRQRVDVASPLPSSWPSG